MLDRSRIRDMKPTVYVETTIPSYLAAWPSRDLVRAAHQQITREWWARRDGFELYSSRLVVQECQIGDAQAAADRLAVPPGIPPFEHGPDGAAVPEADLAGDRLVGRRPPRVSKRKRPWRRRPRTASGAGLLDSLSKHRSQASGPARTRHPWPSHRRSNRAKGVGMVDPEYKRWKRKYPKFPCVAKCVEVLRSRNVRGTWVAS